ncbi:MAG: hypothetical protein ACOQNV_00840 [Mycoplasmoidaceae bacterium]
MLKRKIFLPLVTIATLGGMSIPLISCNSGGDKPGPEPEPETALCFTDIADGSGTNFTYHIQTPQLTKASNDDLEIDIEYSYDESNWDDWDGTELPVEDGQKVYIRNTTNTLSVEDYYFVFSANNYFNASGNIKSLINNSEPSAYCFAGLFGLCTTLVDASRLVLPSTLAESCCSGMFSGCIALTGAPQLPATTLANGCYASMFLWCTSLTEAPALPARTLALDCYSLMFMMCTSLETAPVLPAAALTYQCYMMMFEGCITLEEAPELPAESLAEECYENMFTECTSLTSAPELPAQELAASCYACMFEECSSLIDAPKLPAENLACGCYNGMFRGCSSLEHGPKISAQTLDEMCCYLMFQNCEALKVSEAEEGDDDNLICDFTNVDLTPDQCVEGMFKNTGGTFEGETPTQKKYYWN